MKAKLYNSSNEIVKDFANDGYISVKSLFDLSDILHISKSIESALKLFCNNDHDYHTNITNLNNTNKELLYKFNLVANGLVSNFIVSKENKCTVIVTSKNDYWKQKCERIITLEKGKLISDTK